LAAVLKTLVASPARDACLGIPSVGLSSLYTEAASRIIEKAGGEILLNSPVETLVFEGGSLQEVRLVNGQKISADSVISALPPAILSKILPPSIKRQDSAFAGLDRFTSSPIISVNLWLDRPVTEDLFVGMIGTRFQWLFNKPAILAKAGIEARYVALILSAAHAWIDQPNETLVEMAMEDLRACFPKAKEAHLKRAQVVREREATVSLGCGMERYRPGPVTRFSNFFLAGDWTATDLPATIESAVLSGKKAAHALLQGAQIPR
jgi:zeta-carotene desaturase